MEDLAPALTDLEPIEVASRDETAALKPERMKWSLRHEYDNVGTYRTRFDRAGVHTDDLREHSDLARFPFTVKADLRAGCPFGLAAVPVERIPRVDASSGTTGQSTVVICTMNAIEVWGCTVARSLRASGLRACDALARRIKDTVSVTFEVVVGDPGSVQPSQGKAVRVIGGRGGA